MTRALYPTYGHELRLGMDQGLVVAGVDEVGRGALAGPVVAAAVSLTAYAARHLSSLPINDSKLLSASKRLYLDQHIRKTKGVNFTVAVASVNIINAQGIVAATFVAMRRALRPLKADVCLVDGNRAPQNLSCPSETLVHGDGISLSIACASVIAKVWRDHWMQRLAQCYPEYYWEKNAGYGTLQHRTAIFKCGTTRWHRQQFVLHLNPDALRSA